MRAVGNRCPWETLVGLARLLQNVRARMALLWNKGLGCLQPTYSAPNFSASSVFTFLFPLVVLQPLIVSFFSFCAKSSIPFDWSIPHYQWINQATAVTNNTELRIPLQDLHNTHRGDDATRVMDLCFMISALKTGRWSLGKTQLESPSGPTHKRTLKILNFLGWFSEAQDGNRWGDHEAVDQD